MSTFNKKVLTSASLSLLLMLTACSKSVEEEQVAAEQESQTEITNPKLDYVQDIPDFKQYDLKTKNVSNGTQYSVPVAVSNSLMWLHKNMGHEQLDSELLYPDVSPQEGLILELASEHYMDTNPENGTNVSKLLTALDKYAKVQFNGYQKLEYEGWKSHDAKFAAAEQPNQYRLENFINSKSAAWLNIGWYEKSKFGDEYTRRGDHWVTLVGFDDDKLIIHDPAADNKNGAKHQFISYSILREGELMGDYEGLPQSASGYLQLNNGLNINESYDVAILDGVVYLEL